MNEKLSIRRVIVCVDGVTDLTDGPSKKSKRRNPSSIARLRAIIPSGICLDPQGRTIQQNVHYHQVAPASSLPGSLNFSSKTGLSFERQVQDITYDILRALEHPQDEIFLFGSGYGASTVRAVAGILHYMGVPSPSSLPDFPQLFQNTIDLIKARHIDDSISGGRALQFLRARSQGLPNIKLVGVLDALKSPSTKLLFDTTFNPSIRHFRHALAFNENRPFLSPDLLPTPTAADLQGRSFLQAWFMGGHRELIGGTVHDGLSLYPLQWLIVESMLHGLAVSPHVKTHEFALAESPISLIFPQFAGTAPDLGITESFKWHITYNNNVQVIMFDLQSQHVPAQDPADPSHEVAFESITALYTSPRKVFTMDGVNGYDRLNSAGRIIHPSLFCLLDRNQRLSEQARFKPYKDQLTDFQVNCMSSGQNVDFPWNQGSELLASGVKAFRILVCGKTGVGKSTLINKVFGVEMTEESNSYKQGDHDINTAFESPNHPGLLIHDSRGWQAGSDQELDLIAQFLRHRAFQKDPAEALHVIWFCVDSDVSRIEEADKRTFETIAQFSNHVPVFVVGTKKDKLIAFRKMQLLEEYMEKTNDYQESNRLANLEADRLANEQFLALREQLAQIQSYKADGFVLISKNDDNGVKDLISQTLDMITDERVRLFCVAAQVVDVEHKIDSAITECMRLGTHAVRTAMVPLPFSGMIGTPTVSRILCEHVLQCFGFPKAMPEAVEDIMSRIVMGNLKQFMTVTMTQFMIVGGTAIGVAVATLGIGAIIGIAGSFLSAPPTARMLLKCACDMILILERAFRYGGKYVSVKQIEDAAKQYVSIRTTSFGGKDKRLQADVHEQVDLLCPLKSVKLGFRFQKLRTGFEHIVYKNRFDRAASASDSHPHSYSFSDKTTDQTTSHPSEVDATPVPTRSELPGPTNQPIELPIRSTPTHKLPAELPDTSPHPLPTLAELPASNQFPSSSHSHSPYTTYPTTRPYELSPTSTSTPTSSSMISNSTGLTELSASPTVVSKEGRMDRQKSESSGGFFKKGWSSMKLKKTKSGT